MEEPLTGAVNDEIGITIKEMFMLLWKNIILIIIIVCLSLGVGLGTALLSKRTYTATREVTVECSVVDDKSSNYNNVTLTKLTLPTIAKFCMSSEEVANKAQSLYSSDVINNKLSLGGLSVKLIDEEISMLSFSYTDKSSEIATKKLNNVIKAATDVLAETINGTPDGVPKHFAYRVNIKSLQTTALIKVNSNKKMTVIISGIIGVILAVGIVIIKYLLDDSVKSKDELEKITGVKLFAYLGEVDADTVRGKIK